VKSIIADAGVLVAAYLQDEPTHESALGLVRVLAEGTVRWLAPSLLPYEFTNAMLKALRAGRLDEDTLEQAIAETAKLTVFTLAVDQLATLALARRFGRSAYDAAYLALAEQENAPLITADRRLHNAVKEALPWVIWVADWPQIVT
jgi:predicted nucleic acid-binding protein